LAKAGWDVTVLTAPREFFDRHLGGATDDSLESLIDPHIRVERLGLDPYQWETDVRQFGFLRGNFPSITNLFHQRKQRLIFPERYASWMPRVLAKAVTMHARRRFDLILATGNPFVSFAAAWTLGRLLRIPYVVDYRDAWTFNQFTEKIRVPEGGKAMRWEARVLRDAAEIVFVNDGMRRWHAERYPFAADRMTVVPNGWEPEILGRTEYPPPPADRPLRFGYMGTVTPYLPLRVLFDAWRTARSHPLLSGAELNIYGHLGFFPDEAAPLRQTIALEEANGVHYCGPFDKTDVARVYAATDALVLCVPGARYVTSGKVFEYMATGKPVVSVHQPDIAAAEVLAGYPLWFAGPRLDADTVARSLIAAASAARHMSPSVYEAALSHAENYTRDATLGPWEARLRRLLDESQVSHA